MSGLFGGGQNTSSTETPLTDLSIQTSAYGVALAFGYGRTRVAPNLLWYGDFTAVPHTSTQQMGGKGGGGGSTQTSTSYTYTASYALALGESVESVNQVWIDKLAPVAASTLFTIFTGADPQTPWSYLTGAHPAEAIGYSGMAYVAVAGHDMGNHTNLSNHSFDVTLKLPLGGGVDDADPGQILPDLLTNTQYGVPNFPAGRLGDLSTYSSYCRAAGLLLSPLYDKPQAASQIITTLMQLTNSGVFFSEGMLKVTPYGDANISGHGASYTANLTTLADFTEEDFLVSGTEDPVRVKRNAIPETVSGSADAYNQVTLEILDRNKDYRPVPVVAQDMVSIDTIGLRPMSTITAHEIADAAVGQAVANLILQRVLNIRATYEWSAGWQWCRLEPTDIVSITEPALGLDGYPVRILTIEEDGETGGLKFTAEDVPFGIGHHVAAPTPTLGGYAVNQAIAPGPTNVPVVFEPPNSLTSPDLQLWIAASGGINWGGCEVWASDDGASYRRVGAITNPARHGTLTSLLPAGSDPDTAHTLNVELGACRGQLLPGTTADADKGNTLLWVDGELIAYSGAALTGANAYSLSYLRRGIKGTANATHASASKFVHIDDALFRYSIATDRIGTPIWLKFPAFNTLGFSLEALSDVVAYQHTFAGNKPLSLTALSATGGMFQVSLAWAFNATQIDLDYTEILGATSNNLASAHLLTSVKTPATSWIHPGLQPAQTWYYWGRAVDTSGNKGNFFPTSSTGGVAAAPSADPSALLTQLNTSLGVAQLTPGLSQRIDLIDGPSSTVGTVAQRVAAAALVSANATAAEADARAAAVTSIDTRIEARTADIRALDSAASKIAEATLRALLAGAEQSKHIADAGISLDPATGKARIYALEAVEGRVSNAEIRLDAAAASITQKVTLAEVNNAITAAQLDPTALVGFTDLTARIGVAETEVNALTASVGSKASLIAVDAQGARLTTAESNISAAQGEIANKVSHTTFDALGARMSSAELTLGALDMPGIALAVQDTKYLQQRQDAADSNLLRQLLTGEANKQALTAAVADARFEITTQVTEQGVAQANAKLELAAAIADNKSKLTEEKTARVAEGQALAAATTELVAVVAANTSAISTNETARTSAEAAAAQRSTAIETSVSGLTTALATKAAISYVDAAKSDAISAAAETTALVQAQLSAGGTTAQAIAAAAELAVAEAQAAATTAAAYADGIVTQAEARSIADATAKANAARDAAVSAAAADATTKANAVASSAATAQETANTAVSAGKANADALNTLTAQVADPATGLAKTRSDLQVQSGAMAAQAEASVTDARTLRAQSQELSEAMLAALLSGEAAKANYAGSLALARQELNTTIVTGLSAQAESLLSLTAVVSGQAAQLTEEKIARVAEGQALAAATTELVAVVAANTSAISTNETARTTAEAAAAQRSTAIETSVSGLTTALATKAAISYVDAAKSDAISAAAETTALVQAQLNAGGATAQAIAAAAELAVAEAQSTATKAAAYADGIVTEAENRSIADATAKANAARDAAVSAAAEDATTKASAVAFSAATAQETANTAVSAAGSAAFTVSQVEARLDTGDYAAVKVQSSATANKVGGIEAQYLLQVDANGHVAAIKLSSGANGGALVFLADKFLIAKPDGSGDPIPMLSLGTVNGTTALGLDGHLIVDGSVAARSLVAKSVTADEIKSNTITADLIISASCTSFERAVLSLANGAWTPYRFCMDHAGFVATMTVENFNKSTGGGTYSYDVRCGINLTTVYEGYSGNFTNASGPESISLQNAAWLAAGWHTLYLYAAHSGATGNHVGYATILKSYR